MEVNPDDIIGLGLIRIGMNIAHIGLSASFAGLLKIVQKSEDKIMIFGLLIITGANWYKFNNKPIIY